jgi:putative oxidoreductase
MGHQLSGSAPIGAFVLRIVLAGYWIVHWWFKVGLHGMPDTVQFFHSLGLPGWLAWFDVSYEVAITAMILTGTFLWIACVTSLPILIASMIIYGHNGFYFPTGGIELPIMWAFMQIVMALVGPGIFAMAVPRRLAFLDFKLMTSRYAQAATLMDQNPGGIWRDE